MNFVNRAAFETSTSGTGTLAVGPAVSGYATPAEAGGVDGATYSYVIEDGDDFEVGRGTYSSSGPTCSRDNVYLSKISGVPGTTKLTLSGAARVYLTATAEDLGPVNVSSIADMRNATQVTEFVVLSYYGDGVGGGGRFYCDLSDGSSADNGGNIIVRSDGMRMKRAGFDPYNINVLEFGAAPSVADNSSIYNKIIAAAPNHARIYWPKVLGTWIGHFLPSAGRVFKLDGGKNNFSEVSGTNQPIVYMLGSIAGSPTTTLSADAVYGDKTITVTSGTGFATGGGDMIMLEDGKVRPSDSAKVNQEILMTVGRSGTTITVEDQVRSMQDNGTKNVFLITPIVGPEVHDFNINVVNPYNGSVGHSNSLVSVRYARRAKVTGIHVTNHYGVAVDLRYVYDWLMADCSAKDPINTTPGGYGPSVYVGRKGRNERIEAIGCRNVGDLSACYDVDVEDIRCSRGILPMNYGMTLAHNRHGGAIRVKKARLFDLEFGPVIFNGNQSIASPVDYVLRDIYIDDVEFSFAANASASNKVGIYIQTSFANLQAHHIRHHGFNDASTPHITNAIVRVDGVCYGASALTHLYARRAGTAAFADIPAAPAVTTGIDLLMVGPAHIDAGASYVCYTSGTKHLATQWLTATAVSSAIKIVQTDSGIANVTNDSVGTHAALT